MGRSVALKHIQDEWTLQTTDFEYEQKLMGLDKIGLLDELMNFHRKKSAEEESSLSTMVQGKALFQTVCEAAELTELKEFARQYAIHLDREIEAFVKGKKAKVTI